MSARDAGLKELRPPNDEARSTPHASGPLEQIKTYEQIVNDGFGERKALATLKAQFALLGYSLTELSDGGFLVHRWNLSRSLPDALAARRFYRQIGGAA